MKKVAIIQARMSSTRFPGKVLADIEGKPMLWHVLLRVSKAKQLDYSIVATSTDKSDDPIVKFCKDHKIKYFRGSLENVLSRYFEAAIDERASIIVRICADCPLIDSKLIDEGVNQLMDLRLDYFSNTVKMTFPVGFNFEVLTFAALTTAYKKAYAIAEREHVTPYIWKNHPGDFKIGQLTNPMGDKSKYRVTVDTREDLLVIKQLIKKCKANKKGYRAIIKCLDENPKIVAINKNVVQKQYGD